QFQIEVSFFVRTFFFVYLWLILNVSNVTMTIIIVAAFLILLIGLARFLGVKLLSQLFTDPRQNMLMVTMMPRGLAAAVLAFLPFRQGIANLDYFSEIVFLVIVLTNLVATIGVYMFESSERDAKPRILASGQKAYTYSKK
ncbi:MAG: hypothetical protein V1658_02050, partial [Candidatus Micrarchaeota archaeon]